MHCRYRIQVKVILAVMKLQIKPRKNCEASKAAIGNSIPRGEYFKACILFDRLQHDNFDSRCTL